jgi:RNA polymerase sigma-70 factor (ECF subfamily)
MKTAALSTEAVWSKLGPDLWKFIRRRVLDDHTADDLLQTTFVQIHRNLGGLKKAEQLAGWVYRIARNIVIDHYRNNSNGSSLPESLATDDEHVNCIRAKTIPWLEEMINELPEKYREAVQMAEIEGLPQQAVADRLGLSLSGAKSRIQRGRALLKKALDDCCTFQMDRRGNVLDCEPKPDRKVCRDCDD